MDFNLSEKQAALQENTRRWLADEFSTARIREAEASNEGFPRAVWDEGVRRGWPGASVPAEFGGGGGPLLDACVLLEETGRAGAALPLVSTGVSAQVLEGSPQGAQRDRVLAAIASGKIVSPALIDEQGRNEWDEVRLPLTADGDDHRLTGTKILVPFASVADELVVSVATPAGETALVVVDTNAEGVTITRHHSQIGVPLSAVEFRNVPVADERVVHRGEAAKSALRAGLQVGSLLATAEAIGLSEALIQMTAAYVTQRKAFGQPIGAFQGVAHPVADMRGSTDTVRILLQEAAWLVDNGRDAAEEIASTKALANEFFEKVGNDAFRLHGALAFSSEYDLELFLRRLQGFCQTLGETQESLERAALALGM